MRIVTILLASILSLLGAASASATNPSVNGTAVLSSNKAGATHVGLTLSLRTELQCGRLMGSRPLVLTLPSAARVPNAIATSDVLVGGRAAGRVTVAGHTITIGQAPPRGMLCDSIRFGLVKVVITPAAGLGNPKTARAYMPRVTHGAEAWVLPVRIV